MFRKKKKEEIGSEKRGGNEDEEEETYKIGANNTVAKKAKARFEKYLNMFNKSTNSNSAARKNSTATNSTAPSYGRHSFRTPQPQRANWGLRNSVRQPLKAISSFARNAAASVPPGKLTTPREAVEKRMSIFTDTDGHVSSLRHQDGGRHRSLGEIAMEKKKRAEADMRQTSVISSQQKHNKNREDEELITSDIDSSNTPFMVKPTHSSSSPTFSTPTKSRRFSRISISSSDDDDDTFSMTNTSVTSGNSNYDRIVSDLEPQSPVRRGTTPIAEVTSYDEFVEEMQQDSARVPQTTLDVLKPSAHVPLTTLDVLQPSARVPLTTLDVLQPSARVPLTTLDVLQPSLIDAIHSLESSISSPTTPDMKTVMDAPSTTLQRPATVTSPTEATTADDVFYDVADPSTTATAVTSEPSHQHPAANVVNLSFVSSTASLSSSCYETASDDTAHVLTDVVTESPAPASTVTSQQQQQQQQRETTNEEREGEEKGSHSGVKLTAAAASSSCTGDIQAGAFEESTSSSSSCSSFEILESMPTLTPVKKVALWKSMPLVERKAKLRQAWKKNKDLPVSDDDESVFSDVASSDDCSDIDEDWLNEGADTDDSCISRVDYHNNNNKKRQQQRQRPPHIATAKQQQPKNNNGSTVTSTAKKQEPVKIQTTTTTATPKPISKPQQKAVVVRVIEQNDVIKPAAPRVPSLLVDERKPEAVVATTPATSATTTNNNNDNVDDASIVTEQQPKVGSALKFWSQRLSSTKKQHSGFDASRDSETFNGNTLGRLQGAKALFQSMSTSSASRTPHLPRKTTPLQQQREDDMLTSQTLPRTWKGNKKRQPISNIFETSSSSPSPPPVTVVTRAESMRETVMPPAKTEQEPPPKMVVKETTDVVVAAKVVEEEEAAVEEEEEEAPKTVEEIKAKLAVHSEAAKEEVMVQPKEEEPSAPQPDAAAKEPSTPQQDTQQPLKMLVREDEPFELIEPSDDEPTMVVVAVQDNHVINEEAAAAAVQVEPSQTEEVTTTRHRPVMLVPLKSSSSSLADDYDGNFTDEDLDDVSSLSSGSDDDDVDDASFLDSDA